MARGSVAKQNVGKIFASAFGKDYIGEVGSKHYVWANDGGERVQIAIALTCPKTFVEAPGEEDMGDHDWSQDPIVTKAVTLKPEITKEEMDKVADLMARLGL